MNFNQELKQDAGKIRAGLIPPAAMESMGKVLTFGANKYGAESWEQVEPVRYKDALMRHLIAYLEDPESKDEESGLLSIEHALCNAAFLCHFTKIKKELAKLTFEQVATLIGNNLTCDTCFIHGFCHNTSYPNCAQTLINWLKQEADRCPQPNE